MLQWPTSTTVTKLRAFLGLIGYYGRFVNHYGLIAKPLTQLMRKNQFVWSSKAQRAFKQLKQAMVSTSVLELPNFQETLKLKWMTLMWALGQS
jgi:hypothetical protein